MHRERGDEHVNCYMFVMDIEPFGQVCYLLQMPDLKLGNDPFPGYVSYMLQECVLEEVPCGVVTPGHWALYFCRGALVHAALLLPGERFLSKWGQGHVWEHGKWEAPVTYGDDVKFFKPLSRGALWGLAHFYSATLPGAPEWLIAQAAQSGLMEVVPSPCLNRRESTATP
jgi:hypothetical protein